MDENGRNSTSVVYDISVCFDDHNSNKEVQHVFRSKSYSDSMVSFSGV